MKNQKPSRKTKRANRRCLQRLVRPHRTAMEMLSINGNPSAGLENNTWDVDVLKDQLNRVLQVINGVLDALSTSGTARELTYCELDVCKLGLNALKLSLQGTDSLLVCHKSKTAVWPNEKS